MTPGAGTANQGKKYSSIPPRHSEHFKEAREILQGKHAGATELLELAEKLKTEMRFSYARRLLTRAHRHSEFFSLPRKTQRRILQRLALCTYKDQDLEPDERFKRAIAALTEIEDLTTTKDQETLGLLGAIYKRRWEVDNQRPNLDRSLAYYMRGYREGPEKDQGYTGINAAFVLDLLAELADQEAKEAGEPSTAAALRRTMAKEIREDIIAKVEPLLHDPAHDWLAEKWWYYATVGEAYFGIGNYSKAVECLKTGQATTAVFEWELETCARQLAALSCFQGKTAPDDPVWAVLEEAFGENAAARSAYIGKIGLALSGGGFRASLYHLGVLARLAELDVLRHVEVISCVSGGSIVGAYYYLKVRKLLESKVEGKIGREDYIRIIKEMIDEFVSGVQTNIRTRVALNPLKTLRMLYSSSYSRTNRAGELYEEFLYSKIADERKVSDVAPSSSRFMRTLRVDPLIDETLGRDTQFSPKYQNWRRDAKVPILVLNAAALNTGHTWQFTATWMGESPSGIDSEIDGNDRLRRMYYDDAPQEHKNIRLGDAVGASAAVPAVFEPITLDRLYPERIIRLVDGGVCDNQGVGTLLEQNCNVILVSDGSGQMESQRTPSGGLVGGLLRSDSIFQARIREAQYHDLKGRRRSGLLKGLMFVHLKGDLDVDPIDWIGCIDPYDAADDNCTGRTSLTRYGIHKEIQQLLSGIRTDLDSFTDVEAYALMVSGYRMTEFQFEHDKCIPGIGKPPKTESWKFLELESSMKGGTGNDFEYLRRLLKASGSSAFKVWQIDPWLKYGLRMAIVAALIGVVAYVYPRWNDPLVSDWGVALSDTIVAAVRALTFRAIVLAVAVSVGFYLGARIAASLMGDTVAGYTMKLARWKDTVRRGVFAVVLSTVGCVVAFIHLRVFDRRFLKLGKIDAVRRRRSAVPTPAP